MSQTLLQQKELVATLILGIHLYVDWYLGLAFSAQILTFGFILFCYLQRADLAWTKPRTFWIWLVFLALALIPAFRAISLTDSIYYYGNVLLSSILFFWLGLLIVRDIASARRFFSMLAFVGALLAIHTIVQARTGIVLFKTTRYDASLDQLRHFVMGKTGILRVESIFLNPNSNGAFFGFIFFLPLGLFTYSKSYAARAFYCIEMLLMLLALYVTYSTGAWVALGFGLICFLFLVGRMGPRIQMIALLAILSLVLVLGFPQQLRLLWEHATGPDEFSLRWAVWQTGLRVILAFPLFGIGLGRYIYIIKSDPYRVPEQFIPVYHPHNSYLEVAALGGIPLALIFLVLLGDGCWLAWRNWRRSSVLDRSLLAGGLALIASLSVNSLGNPGWTLTPLLSVGWLVLGGLASPFLAPVHTREGQGENNPSESTAVAEDFSSATRVEKETAEALRTDDVPVVLEEARDLPVETGEETASATEKQDSKDRLAINEKSEETLPPEE